jgi:hypothetical protein
MSLCLILSLKSFVVSQSLRAVFPEQWRQPERLLMTLPFQATTYLAAPELRPAAIELERLGKLGAGRRASRRLTRSHTSHHPLQIDQQLRQLLGQMIQLKRRTCP